MKINKQEFLRSLESVVPGLTSRETTEQSSSFVFQNGKVRTFNDEVACLCDIGIDITGAVSGKQLLNMLRKMPDDEIDIKVDDGEFVIRGKRRKASFRMDSEIEMPIDDIGVPDEWLPLSDEFSNAVGMVYGCASNDENDFVLTNIHVHPDFIEAMDNFQSIRYPIRVGIEKPMLVKRKALKGVVGIDVNEFSETESWVHFRSRTGLTLSCRRYMEDYPDLSKVFEISGEPIKFPNKLDKAISRAEIFSAENVEDNLLLVELKTNRIKLEGIGSIGSYTEVKQVEYDGPSIRFKTSPSMLLTIIAYSDKCLVSPGRLIVQSEKFTFVVATGKVNDEN